MTSLYYFTWIGSFGFLCARELYLFKRWTPAAFIAALHVFSVISLFLARPSFSIENYGLGNVIFQYVVSFILVLSTLRYSKIRQVILLNKTSERTLVVVVSVMSVIGLLLNSYLVYKSLTFFSSIDSGISQFKNEKIAAEYLKNSVPSFYYTLIAISTPFSFFALLFHFYFLVQLDRRRAIMMLIFSLSIPLGALQELSRGRLVLFIEMYLFLYFAVSAALHKKIRQKFKRLFLLVSVPIVYALGFITVDRFRDSSHESTGLVQDPVLLSLFDYAGQWHENSLIVLERFRPESVMYGSRFGYFIRWIKDKLGYEIVDQFDRDIEVFGMLGTQFRGLVSNLVYDLGYTFTICFVLLIWKFSGRYLSKSRKRSDVRGLMFYFGVVLFQSSFYQGNIVVLSFVSFTYLYILVFLNYDLSSRLR